MLGEDISSTYPSQNMPPLISVLKLFRKLIMGDVLEIATPALSRTLSLIPSWSATKALLGAVSEVTVVVTHMVPSPGSGFEATHPGGSAGAVTLSQFSTHGPPGVGVGVGAGVGVPLGVVVAVGVGVAPVHADGPWIPTVIGDPVLKKPIVAVATCGGLSESKRKLYIVPKRIAFAF